jgi:VanZ family protein
MKIMKAVLRWLPCVLLMGVIFAFSSFPSSSLPDYGSWDTLVKKAGHMAGYGMLAVALWYPLGWRRNAWLPALLLAVAHALGDEFHQSFVPGRHASWVDALVIDPAGALLGLACAAGLRRGRQRPRPPRDILPG